MCRWAHPPGEQRTPFTQRRQYMKCNTPLTQQVAAESPVTLRVTRWVTCGWFVSDTFPVRFHLHYRLSHPSCNLLPDIFQRYSVWVQLRRTVIYMLIQSYFSSSPAIVFKSRWTLNSEQVMRNGVSDANTKKIPIALFYLMKAVKKLETRDEHVKRISFTSGFLDPRYVLPFFTPSLFVKPSTPSCSIMTGIRIHCTTL